MSRRWNLGRDRAGAALALAAALAAAALGGCGDKITIPRPTGLFSVTNYHADTLYTEQQPVQVAVINNNLFVLDGSGVLVKRGLRFTEIGRVPLSGQPTAFCPDERGQLVFVWQQASRTVGIFNSSNLDTVEISSPLADVDTVAAVAACARGIESVAGALTFLYLSDPHAGVIHRYAYTQGGGLLPYGLLARSDGEGARAVHVPAGMAVDRDGMLLVCDADPARNWVIRFDPTPSSGDVTPLWHGQQPQRGHAIVFADSTCSPAAPIDVTLGDAAACGQADWVGGTSADPGEFNVPRGLAVDGSGQVFVADSGNNRIQLFNPDGSYVMLFGTDASTPGPVSLGSVDWRTGALAGNINYGAYLFVLTPGTNQVRKFISDAQYTYINKHPPPP